MFRKLWAVLAFGVLAAVGMASPAMATGDRDRGQVTVAMQSGCDRQVVVLFQNTTRMVAEVKVTGHDGSISVPARDGDTPGTASVTVTAGDDGKVQAYIKIGRDWRELGKCFTWEAPDKNCLAPVVDVTHPDCAHPGQTVTVSNPGENPLPVVVRFDNDAPASVAPGAHVEKTATVAIIVVIDDGQPTTYSYTAPTGCASASASPSPSPSVSTGGSAGGATGGSPHLPVTGTPVIAVGVIGAVAVLAGVLGVVVARRRRTTFTA